MWLLTVCKISVSLSFLNWNKNEMIFIVPYVANFNSEIQYEIISFQELRDCLKFYRLSSATFYDYIYQFIKPFLENKMPVFEKYAAFNHTL